jgi:hypothetical protein
MSAVYLPSEARKLHKTRDTILLACLSPSPLPSIVSDSNKVDTYSYEQLMLLNNTIVLNDWIANQVRLDFAQGAVVSVEGWLLSLTEARVYTLVVLSSEMG